MSNQPQFWITDISLVVATIGLVVAVFSFWNSRQARLENRENILFKIKLDALVAAKEVEVCWQDAVNEVARARERFGVSASNEKSEAFRSLGEWEEEFRGSLSRAKEMIESCRAGFDSWSAESAASVLRECLVNKLTVQQARDEMRRRLAVLQPTPMRH